MMIMMMIMIIENLISILSFHSYIMTLVIVNYYQHQHKHQDLNVHLNQIICCVCQLKTHWDFRLLSSFSFIHSFNLMRTFFFRSKRTIQIFLWTKIRFSFSFSIHHLMMMMMVVIFVLVILDFRNPVKWNDIREYKWTSWMTS